MKAARLFVGGILWVVLVGDLWAAEPEAFFLIEHRGHNWQSEPVTFPLSPAALAEA